jgi:hypothetical protein
MDRLLDLLKTAGYSQSEAITKMSNDAKGIGLKGFSEASIRRGLTDESKKGTKPGPRKTNQMITSAKSNSSVSFQPNRRLVVPEEPAIPPLPEVHQEAQIVREREPPKPIEEPINLQAPEHQSKTIEVVFDPAPIDRDRTQVFIMQIDIVTKKVIKYKTVGRRSVR